MADIFNFFVYDDRTIQFELAEPIMLEDTNVTQFKFRIPKSINGFDMTGWSWWLVYVNALRQKYSVPLTFTDDEDEPDVYANAVYTVDYGMSGTAGTVSFALEAINADATTSEVLNEWHTKTYSTRVISTLQGNEAEFEQSEIDIISGMIQDMLAQIREMIDEGGTGGKTSDDIENKSTVSGATVTNALTSLSDQIANEATERQTAVSEVQNAVTAEETARRNAVASVEASVTSEASTRASADESLRQAIDDLVSPSGQSVVVDSSLTIRGAAADAKATGDKLTEIEEGVADASLIGDGTITMSKTDFYTNKSVEITGDWFTKTYQNTKIPNVKFAQDVASVVANWPDVLTVVAPNTANYWSSGNRARFDARTRGYSSQYVQIEKTVGSITVDDVMYGYITITKSQIEAAYAEFIAMVEDQSLVIVGGDILLGNNPNRFNDTNYYVISGELTQELILSNFTKTSISQEFVEAVKKACESEDGTSQDEQLAKKKLTGKVMLCLGDSYTYGMRDLLTALGTKYGMIVDNRGVVSSSICGDGSKGYRPMWSRADTIISEYKAGYTIDNVSYGVDDVGIVVFMGGANDGFGVTTWIGTGIHETDTGTIYGACNHIFSVLAETFTSAKVICITQPSSYNRTVSSIEDDATAQTLGFDDLTELQKMDDVQFSNYAMAQKENAVYKTAWAYGWPIIDMFHDFPTIFNPVNRSTYWSSDKLHLTTKGYGLITEALDAKIVDLVVG